MGPHYWRCGKAKEKEREKEKRKDKKKKKMIMELSPCSVLVGGPSAQANSHFAGERLSNLIKHRRPNKQNDDRVDNHACAPIEAFAISTFGSKTPPVDHLPSQFKRHYPTEEH
jgi:hypothetical protein